MKKSNLHIWYLIGNICMIAGIVMFIISESSTIITVSSFGLIILGGLITFIKVKCPHCGKVIGGLRGWTEFCPFCKRNING